MTHPLADCDSGLYWLCCDGPDGRVVLLAYYENWTGTVTLVDDGCSAHWACKHIGRWTVLDARPVERPEPWATGEPS